MPLAIWELETYKGLDTRGEAGSQKAMNAKDRKHRSMNPKPKRVALYARVSTSDQQTLSMQLRALREYAKQQGYEVVVEVQEIQSGVKDRPQREEIMKLARRKKIDLVLVWKLDRWGRSVVDLIHSLQELLELAIGFVSLTEALDLHTPTGRALAGMLAVFAEFERDLLKERITAGITQAKREGKHCGRPASVKAKSKIIVTRYHKKESLSEIARSEGISRSSVRRILVAEKVLS